ncbi:hypothetical protein GPL15_26190 [Clostridium sp. MCC353]|uniref:hypothetical protein n=1 Tax=Clostridium sp. MCC353 TaxID=2592646 RepID=UPI001C026885|nr:hypothetical protein [Clostridium sp. MCC353]MBT9779961.1 hypothetical protein [Clostridium sp. MCC353]
MNITQEDRDLFHNSCDKIIEKERERHGIGTLGEKTVHAVLKHYLDPREEYHEQRCCGFVADILAEGEITEIQTRSFDRLRRKLDAFLDTYEVTIVYPIPSLKWVIWIDEETGEVTDRRKSPKKGSYYHVFYELYKIKQYLSHPRLHLRLMLISMEEYRLLNGWSRDKKRGSSRYDRIPVDLEDELYIASVPDYRYFLPESLPHEFTSAEYAKSAKLTLRQAQTALNVLTCLETVERAGKRGRSILYRANDRAV